MAAGNDQTQRIRDPVHGLIVFGRSGDKHRDETDRIAWRLLNTPEFQRLRRIRQLGFSDLVFPGATHSRFAHSIGVYHTARRLAEVIARQQGERHSDRERVALLAALLHDVGHGPFSHAFEVAAQAAGSPKKRHEGWGAEIIRGDTGVNRVLREVDDTLPEVICGLLKEEEPKDIYATIVSSQFDADRLDYIQRDRMATGVEFGHVDQDWLFDCMEVGKVTIGREDPHEAPCLYLGWKGLSVAEEYLEARFRLYQMVYMHKTTRSAEKMLEALLEDVAEEAKTEDLHPEQKEPVSRYLALKTPSLGAYIDLDDAVAWAAILEFAKRPNQRTKTLARRLRDRELYKCVDIGVLDDPGGNLYRRVRRELNERPIEEQGCLLFDDATVVKAYEWYDFDDASALNKVLLKTPSDSDGHEPKDIATISPIVKTLQEKRIQRVYAPDSGIAQRLREIIEEVRR